MVNFPSVTESDSPLSIKTQNPNLVTEKPLKTLEVHGESPQTKASNEENPWPKKKKKNQICLEGYEEAVGEMDEIHENGPKGFLRTKSLTDEDLDELKGCLDLGFGFSYEEIPELCNTLPALELCYSMSQRFMDENHKLTEAASEGSPIANWRISGPGDHPEEVKARLKLWAQAVAYTVRLCS
ncbi:hypothetical protein MRB53_004370 [Persea americana]|uniref:Uncharacterized protein n=1 Tax=Persea americana TaxID=3435 RepID=A0ACC2MAD9_PERAE|nr:hypothetical protein MRB53_004370 [Persea americana]|eukprot:TRINITY_DN1853_c1_g1_i1.p1 TRINITY_DN1853_c1_g1~~TRINITY_DN1853_c1_g1_i1.p1  ORF type:complete len:183 (+),score=31.78 TRINITY_DN1853_c1_g1_i1:57-605(+)